MRESINTITQTRVERRPRAFGQSAQVFCERYDPPHDTLVADRGFMALATLAALERRAAGERVRIKPLLTYRRMFAAYALSTALVNTPQTWTQRAFAFDMLADELLAPNGAPQRDFGKLTATELLLAKSLLLSAESCVCGSWTEVQLLGEMLGYRPTAVETMPSLDRWVPTAIHRAEPKTVVVWAPDKNAEQLGVVLAAIHDERISVTLICDGGRCDVEHVRIVDRKEAAAALGEARVVVDYSCDEPGSAIALAGLGLPLAVASTSGASEYVGGVAVFDPWSRRSLSRAIQTAAFSSPRVAKTSVGSGVEAQHVVQAQSTPKISVVVPTLNRSGLLDRTLRSIEKQTYRNVEIVICNDGGDPVKVPGDITLPVQIISHEKSMGLPAARNSAIRAAQGDLIAFLDDDDAYLPDHLERSASTLDRGADLSYADYALCFASSGDGEQFFLHGAHCVEHRPQPADFLIANQIGVLTTVVRRSTLGESPFDERLPVCEDFDLWLRLLKGGAQFSHNGGMTALYTVRLDKQNMSSSRKSLFFPTYQELYALHPVLDESGLPAKRRAVMDNWRMLGGPPDLSPLVQFTPPLNLKDLDLGFRASSR